VNKQLITKVTWAKKQKICNIIEPKEKSLQNKKESRRPEKPDLCKISHIG
jgi:hypothetical protein